MEHLTLEAWPRTTDARSAGAQKVRREGYIPGILVGHHETAIPLKVKAGDLTRVLKSGGRNALVDLDIEGQKSFAMVREFRRDPVSRSILHIDFQRVMANEPIEAAVPVVITGSPAPEYDGYIVTHETATLLVRALPDALPTRIDIDAATLLPGHPLHASDITLAEGVTMVTDGTHVVTTLAPPRTTEAEETEGEAAAETAEAETTTTE